MNDILKRRLVGLLVLLVLVFVLTWLLPDNWSESGEKGVPSVTVPLTANAPDAGTVAPKPEPAASATTIAATEPASPAVAQPATSAASAPPKPADSSAPPLPSTASASQTPKPGNSTPTPHIPKTAAAASPPKAPVLAPDQPKPTAAAKAESGKPQPPQLKLSPTLPAAAMPGAPVVAAPKPLTPSMPVTPRLATSVQAPPPAAAAASQARLWYVQIGSFADQGNAQTTLSLLQNIGYRGESQRSAGPAGGILYRVRLGPFPSGAVAQTAFDKVSHQGYPQARVLSEAAAKR